MGRLGRKQLPLVQCALLVHVAPSGWGVPHVALGRQTRPFFTLQELAMLVLHGCPCSPDWTHTKGDMAVLQ